MLPSLDIIIVNWNTGALLRDCLKSISQAGTTAFRLERVVVIDNHSADGSADGLEALSEQPISVLHNNVNRGFAAACNQGAAGTQADYLLFLNPDTRVFPDSLWRPLEFLDQKENAKFGICGLRHVDDSGGFSTSCARFPTLRIFFGQMTGLSRLFPRWFPCIQASSILSWSTMCSGIAGITLLSVVPILSMGRTWKKRVVCATRVKKTSNPIR